MIIRSRAPPRLGLAGGGTDVSPYCDQYRGAVLNVTIDQYAYAIMEPTEDDRVCFTATDTGAHLEGAADGGFVTFLVAPERRMDVIRALSRQDGHVMVCHFTRHGTEGWKIL